MSCPRPNPDSSARFARRMASASEPAIAKLSELAEQWRPYRMWVAVCLRRTLAGGAGMMHSRAAGSLGEGLHGAELLVAHHEETWLPSRRRRWHRCGRDSTSRASPTCRQAQPPPFPLDRWSRGDQRRRSRAHDTTCLRPRSPCRPPPNARRRRGAGFAAGPVVGTASSGWRRGSANARRCSSGVVPQLKRALADSSGKRKPEAGGDAAQQPDRTRSCRPGRRPRTR